MKKVCNLAVPYYSKNWIDAWRCVGVGLNVIEACRDTLLLKRLERYMNSLACSQVANFIETSRTQNPTLRRAVDFRYGRSQSGNDAIVEGNGPGFPIINLG